MKQAARPDRYERQAGPNPNSEVFSLLRLGMILANGGCQEVKAKWVNGLI